MSPLRGSPVTVNGIVSTRGTRYGSDAQANEFGRTKVRPYNTLLFRVLRKPLQKGADYPVIST